jgi:hypothetical protein
VVSLDSPTPRVVTAGRSEQHRPEVAVVPVAVPAFAVVEHVFQCHHRCGLRISVWTEHGREHAVHRLALLSPKLT